MNDSEVQQLLKDDGPVFFLREPTGSTLVGMGAGASAVGLSWRKFHSPCEKAPSIWKDFAESGHIPLLPSRAVEFTARAPISKPLMPFIGDKLAWQRLCEKAEHVIQSGQAKKLVPSRKVSAPISQEERAVLLDALCQRLFSAPMKNAFRFLVKSGSSFFFGATPEQLFRRENGEILVPAIAGTLAQSNENEESSLPEELLASEKDRREHDLVVQGICSSLSSLGLNPRAEATPRVIQVPGLLHLYTSITAADDQRVSSEELMTTLHPTAAIGGYPKLFAKEFLHENETWDRGLFSAPLLFRVENRETCLVAIRSALITSNELHFFAGAGYVKGSTPEAEWQETERKLRVMQMILFGDVNGRK